MLPNGDIRGRTNYYLGLDIARMGQDSSVFIVVSQREGGDQIFVEYIEETKHKLLTDPVGRVQVMNKLFKFNKINLDCTGLGEAVADMLKEKMAVQVEGIRFSVQSKQDIYSNLKILLESGKLKIPNHRKLLFQLRDLRYQHTSSGNTKIHHSEGGQDDYCDALALAVYDFRPKRKAQYFIG